MVYYTDMKSYQDSSFWFSKLQDHRTCPKMYKLRHLDKIKVESRSIDTEFGTALHMGLNQILTGEGDGILLFNTYWESIKGVKLTQFKFGWDALKEMGPVFLDRFKRLHAKHITLFKGEERMFATVSGHEMEGTPDALGEYKGIPSIMDFKTSSSRYKNEKIISDDQMPSYAHYAKTHYGYEPKQKVYIVFIKDFKNPSIQVCVSELTTDNIQSSIDNMISEIEEIKAKNHFTQNRSSCVRGPIVCPYWEICHGKKETVCE
jgi:hypothetical protein